MKIQLTNNRLVVGLDTIKENITGTQEAGIRILTGAHANLYKRLGMADNITVVDENGKNVTATVNNRSFNKWIARTTAQFPELKEGLLFSDQRLMNRAINELKNRKAQKLNRSDILKNHVLLANPISFTSKKLTKKNIKSLFLDENQAMTNEVQQPAEMLKASQNNFAERQAEQQRLVEQEQRSIEINLKQAEEDLQTAAKIRPSFADVASARATPQKDLKTAQVELRLATKKAAREKKTLTPAELQAKRALAEHELKQAQLELSQANAAYKQAKTIRPSFAEALQGAGAAKKAQEQKTLETLTKAAQKAQRARITHLKAQAPVWGIASGSDIVAGKVKTPQKQREERLNAFRKAGEKVQNLVRAKNALVEAGERKKAQKEKRDAVLEDIRNDFKASKAKKRAKACQGVVEKSGIVWYENKKRELTRHLAASRKAFAKDVFESKVLPQVETLTKRANTTMVEAQVQDVFKKRMQEELENGELKALRDSVEKLSIAKRQAIRKAQKKRREEEQQLDARARLYNAHAPISLEERRRQAQIRLYQMHAPKGYAEELSL